MGAQQSTMDAKSSFRKSQRISPLLSHFCPLCLLSTPAPAGLDICSGTGNMWRDYLLLRRRIFLFADSC